MGDTLRQISMHHTRNTHTYAGVAEQLLAIYSVLKTSSSAKQSARIIGIGAYQVLIFTPPRRFGISRRARYKSSSWHDLESCVCPGDPAGLTLEFTFASRPNAIH